MDIWSGSVPYAGEFVPYLTPHPVEDAKTAIVVCPGGGYHHRAPHEGDGYAQWLNTIGIAAFVLEYRIVPDKAPTPMADAQRAIRLVRQMGYEKVGIMGSSAGGHLAATVSVHYDHAFYDPQDAVDQLSARPDFSVLCYPVIDMGQYRHDGSRQNLLGSRVSSNQLRFYSPQLNVSETTPPAFIWHCSGDSSVPSQNALLYAMALAENNVDYELHIYAGGGHGWGLAEDKPRICQWSNALKNWLLR